MNSHVSLAFDVALAVVAAGLVAAAGHGFGRFLHWAEHRLTHKTLKPWSEVPVDPSAGIVGSINAATHQVSTNRNAMQYLAATEQLTAAQREVAYQSASRVFNRINSLPHYAEHAKEIAALFDALVASEPIATEGQVEALAYEAYRRVVHP